MFFSVIVIVTIELLSLSYPCGHHRHRQNALSADTTNDSILFIATGMLKITEATNLEQHSKSNVGSEEQKSEPMLG